MTSEIQTIEPHQRDSFDEYVIHSGCKLIFPFSLPMFGALDIKVQHTKEGSQDFSLCLWISEAPLDGMVLQHVIGHFNPLRQETSFRIYDALSTEEAEDRPTLPSGRTYYANVKNLQNSPNTFMLALDPA